MCLTLANAAFVLDHVDSVRPARSFTRTLHHAGHLSPGDLWRALDGEYPRTAILVRRHHDVITLTDQYGDTFAYPTAATIPTAVPDAFQSGRRAADPATPGRASAWTARPNETGLARSNPNGATPATRRGGVGSTACPASDDP